MLGPDRLSAGAEHVTFDLPEDGRTYRLGVHAWDDHGYGPSAARLRVWIFGQLAWQSPAVELATGDLWEAAVLSWPSARVEALTDGGGGARVLSGYEAPCAPGGGCKGAKGR
jgi:hypothetical protein